MDTVFMDVFTVHGRECFRFPRNATYPKGCTESLLSCVRDYVAASCDLSGFPASQVACGPLVRAYNSLGFQPWERPARSRGFWVTSGIGFSLQDFIQWLDAKHPAVAYDLRDFCGEL